ncbi:MAG: ABC transporter ATP-binding protein [Clostridia bacterium]|nr:ABC transporter ATP-binding protein [Clostridia bacterium]
MSEILFDNFSAWYKNKKEYVKALDSLQFEIHDGEFFVVAGTSGCGKTTLLRSILGTMEYTEGTLTVDGLPLDDGAQKRNIGYVRQEPGLYPHLTIYENIAFPLRTIHTLQDEIDRRVKKIAQMLEIDWLLTRKPLQLSGGQQQRAALARALVKQPTVLLLDEPFSDLEPTLHRQMRLLVKNLQQQLHITAVFVTHDLAEAFSLADRLLVLEDGRIADLASPRELLKEHHCDLLKEFLK